MMKLPAGSRTKGVLRIRGPSGRTLEQALPPGAGSREHIVVEHEEVDRDEGDRDGSAARPPRPGRWSAWWIARDLATPATHSAARLPMKNWVTCSLMPGVWLMSKSTPTPDRRAWSVRVPIEDDRIACGDRCELGGDLGMVGREVDAVGVEQEHVCACRVGEDPDPVPGRLDDGVVKLLRLAPAEGLRAPGAGIGLHGLILPARIPRGTSGRWRSGLPATCRRR
jgi:hypothetical protein